MNGATVYSNNLVKYDILRGIVADWSPPKKDTKQRKFLFKKTPDVNQEEQKSTVKDWAENESPSIQADLVDNEDEQVLELIFLIRRNLSKTIANKLSNLFCCAKEEDPTNPGITFSSLSSFYNFLLNINLKKYPTISLTPNNDIYAVWENEENQSLDVLFLQNRNVRFLIVKPNDRHPERKTRHSGIETTDTLKKETASSGVWDWISE